MQDILTPVIAGLVTIGALYFFTPVSKKHREAKRRREAQYQEYLLSIAPDIRKVHDAFFKELETLKAEYISNSKAKAFVSKYEETVKRLKGYNVPVRYKPYSDEISAVCAEFNRFSLKAEEYTRGFVTSEIKRCDGLLSNIDGKSLDPQQRKAVVTDEDHMLVLAGAGSGKTLTISGKVKYLCDVKKVKPEDILLIAYTRKAAEEMSERIVKKLGVNVHASTFHKLGKDIIAAAKGISIDIDDNLDAFIRDFFETRILNDNRIVKKLIEFFAFYLVIPTDLDKYDTLGEAYEHQKNMDFETLKSKYDRSRFIDEQQAAKRAQGSTLKGEEVKSFEEVAIANFLFLNGVRYEYEKLYPHRSNEPEYRAYHPDFYLPDYDIYIEHFGITKDGRVPWLSGVEAQKYLEGIDWKRHWHRVHNTTLLETYSYYSSEGRLLEELENMLQKHGVVFREADYLDIFDAVYQRAGDRYFSEFIKLCSTFITLLKSAGLGAEDVHGLKYKTAGHNSAFEVRRTELFKDIIYPIVSVYQQDLDERNAIDFSDMIIQSTEIIKDGYKIHPYKYIIIDEFQDISIARYRLVKAILDQTGAKLFCVGDDWQSIFRFAGSDISVFTKFEEHFGYTEVLKIEQTYRNSQELVNIMGEFIMKNPLQMKKRLKSEKSLDKPIRFIPYEKNARDQYNRDLGVKLQSTIDAIVNEFGENSSLLFLGRTKYDINLLKNSGLFTVTERRDEQIVSSDKYPALRTSFLSVHKAKGLEADNVILLNFENAILGFPNKIADDPLLELVLSIEDSYTYAEERRLLYVALTRTRNYSYVLVNSKSPSEFLKDFDMELNKDAPDCPKCKTGKLIRRQAESGRFFYGCSNYPFCDYTLEDGAYIKCNACGGYMVLRQGQRGKFWGCVNYPRCKNTEQYNMMDTAVKRCPKCSGYLVIRKGRNGAFLGCSNYPTCKHTEPYEQ